MYVTGLLLGLNTEPQVAQSRVCQEHALVLQEGKPGSSDPPSVRVMCLIEGERNLDSLNSGWRGLKMLLLCTHVVLRRTQTKE